MRDLQLVTLLYSFVLFFVCVHVHKGVCVYILEVLEDVRWCPHISQDCNPSYKL